MMRVAGVWRTAAVLTSGTALAVMTGCGSGSAPTGDPKTTTAPAAAAEVPTTATLPPITLPDLSRLAPAVQAQVRAAANVLEEANRSQAPARDTAAAAGALGRLLLAAELRPAAASCFLHASAGAPDDPRWPYYLGHTYRMDGQAADAAAAFERARQIKGDDVPTLVWLGRTRLDLGQPEQAATAFEQAHTLQPHSAAVLLGLGEAALARHDDPRAVAWLEEALALDAQATPIRHALAQAYRRTGQSERADLYARAGALEKVRFSDPLLEEIDALLETGVAYEIRGGRALERRDWAAAADLFRKGIALAPEDPSLRHKLGTALALGGDQAGAVRQFQEVVRRWPQFAKGQYSLGVILAASGQAAQALTRFEAAAASAPQDTQARLQVAETRRALARFPEAIAAYDEVLALDPRAAPARFGRAMALVGAGRYRESIDALGEAARLFPKEGAFPHAQARLLAAAPADGLRNPGRALSLLQGLGIERRWTVPMAETMAMALAEMGRFDEAVRWQRDALGEARKSGPAPLLPRLLANLALYEQKRPCRTPWGDELRYATL